MTFGGLHPVSVAAAAGGVAAGEVKPGTQAESAPMADSRSPRLDLSLCVDEPSFWRRALSSAHDEYCRYVHRTQANLAVRPALAEQFARAALKLSPRGVVAQLLLGETLLFQAEAQGAHEHLQKWMALAPPEALTPRLRVSAARAALLSGDYAVALELYRTVVLRLDGFSSSREQARILIEAATAAAYAQSKSGREVRGYLAIARQKSAPLLVETLVGAWVLSLLREDRIKEATAMAQSLNDSWTLPWIVERQDPSLGKPSEVLPVLPPGEGFAMAAAVAQVLEPEHAENLWLSFREFAEETWPTHIERATPPDSSGDSAD